MQGLPIVAGSNDACCGQAPCEYQFDDFFCQALLLGPDWQQQICEDGVYHNLIKALISPWWNAYVCCCGICDFEREISPLTACCTLERWIAEYGVDNDGCFDEVCFLSEDQQTLSRRARLHVRAMLEWGATFNQELVDMIAGQLGISYTALNPTFFADEPRQESDPCVGPVGISGLQGPENDVLPEDDCSGVMGLGRSFTCRELENIAAIRIDAAPPSIYATACDPVAQPLIYNPWIEAFKCLLRDLVPCHVRLCIEECCGDECGVNDVPRLQDPCPTDSGFYVSPVIDGEGTLESPFRLDPSKLTRAQTEALIRRACLFT